MVRILHQEVPNSCSPPSQTPAMAGADGGRNYTYHWNSASL
ncbi:hypothetical protein MUK42_05454 [Musa troglodytarum]|uniref:Uncharacterized protein n=1 Tax=Musa troglodytarum TaxID=320322 RepID=A0A9E7GNM5_9LILI|nr:hypothetical protein MUK42_05454 [Musa troglodytarum]